VSSLTRGVGEPTFSRDRARASHRQYATSEHTAVRLAKMGGPVHEKIARYLQDLCQNHGSGPVREARDITHSTVTLLLLKPQLDENHGAATASHQL
jgi:hypothetical protein